MLIADLPVHTAGLFELTPRGGFSGGAVSVEIHVPLCSPTSHPHRSNSRSPSPGKPPRRSLPGRDHPKYPVCYPRRSDRETPRLMHLWRHYFIVPVYDQFEASCRSCLVPFSSDVAKQVTHEAVIPPLCSNSSLPTR